MAASSSMTRMHKSSVLDADRSQLMLVEKGRVEVQGRHIADSLVICANPFEVGDRLHVLAVDIRISTLSAEAIPP